MTFISYAQNQEDVMLYRALRGVERGFYIDVGANDPVLDSVTKAFYERGWCGINIEPDPVAFRKLSENRTRDTNLEIAIGDRTGSGVLFDTGVRGHATLDREVAEEKRGHGQSVIPRKVEVRTLRDVCQAYAGAEIHFLKIDVEGCEHDVLSGMDFSRFRPWVVVVEAVHPESKAHSHAHWEHLLLNSEYVFVYFDGLNRYYIAAEHPELKTAFSSPPNVFDEAVKFGEIELARKTQLRLAAREAELALIQQQLASREADFALTKQQLNAVYSSRSWRITEPLRLASAKLRLGANKVAELFAWNRRSIRSKLRGVILWTVNVVARHEGTKNVAISVIRKFPAIDYRIRAAINANRRRTVCHIPVSELVDVGSNWNEEARAHSPAFTLPLPPGERTLYLYVDHTTRCPTNTGMQRVTRRLAAALLNAGEKVRFVKWDETCRSCVLVDRAELKHLGRWNGPQLQEVEQNIYPSPGDPPTRVLRSRLGENNWLIVPEVTHITYHPEPVTLKLLMWAREYHLNSGFIFYDAIPLRRPELREMAAKHSQYIQQLLLADVVWPISSWSAADLCAFWTHHEMATPRTMAEVITLPLPGESHVGQRVLKPERGGNLILCVGSVEPRKNQVHLVDAFEKVLQKYPEPPWRLVLIGNLHPLVADKIARATEANPAIQHVGNLSDRDLDALYRSCAFTVFPSVEEGFGLPILESLWYGKPCICANFGAMAEVARGGGCMTVNTHSVHAISEAIAQLICEPTELEKLAGEAVSRRISVWSEYAGQIIGRVNREADVASRLGRIYYWIEHTVDFYKNTGIQRVARQLARGLLELGVEVVPVKWDSDHRKFTTISDKELDYFAQWNGPKREAWSPFTQSPSEVRANWFFMPELPLNRSQKERATILDYAATLGLKSAAVFYDAIPWKMRALYPEEFSTAHKEYLEDLQRYDLVLPISEYSREDLLEFLGRRLPRPKNLEERIKAAILPGEFPESPRVQQVGESRGEAIRFLCVGTVEPRKNHVVLLKAFEKAQKRARHPLHLTIVGRTTDPGYADVVRTHLSNDPAIVWEDNADDERLAQLQNGCDATVYPSVEEGFGLPILESLWHAKPCICANFGAMKEVAEGGGCLMVDVRSVDELSEAIVRVADDRKLRLSLAQEATRLRFKSWREYASEVAAYMAEKKSVADVTACGGAARAEVEKRATAMGLGARPLLSICITTYNRAAWLSANLKTWCRLYPKCLSQVEFLVCDNASTDRTQDVVKPYLSRPDFSYYRNPSNVGMLGNLRETAHHARGQFIWTIGDDDLMMPGSIERVLNAIERHPDVALIYLNYAYTRITDVLAIDDFDLFYREATPIVPSEDDRTGPIRNLCARNENFFTGIYSLVFRRDHAIKAYSQDTSGRPFSTMLTCIPTTYYVLHHMMDELGCWIGQPQVVVNMNVSWIRYAALWILERIPEVYEVAEQKGASPEEIDRWRRHSLPSVLHYFQEIFENDPLGNAAYFSPQRLVWRFKHLPEFQAMCPALREIYAKAQATGHSAAKLPLSRVFPEEAAFA